MGLTTALGAALSGLKTSQRGLDLVATNVANSQTPGYTRKSLVTEAAIHGGSATGVRVSDVRRELDVYLQRQLRVETAGGAYADTRADYLDRLQSIFGTPGGALSLDVSMSDFSSSLDALAASPDDQNARGAVLAQARLLAQTLNTATRDVQDLRGQADQAIADSIAAANEALQEVGRYSKQIIVAQARGEPTGNLEDLRDAAIDTLTSLMDVKVDELSNGDVRLRTSGGATLYDGEPSTLSFESAGTVTAGDAYGTGGSLSGVTLTRPSGQPVDILAGGQLRSGAIKALADMRDTTLTQAQGQLDELAANLAQALGTNTVTGTAVAGGVSLTTVGALRGDQLSATFVEAGVTRSITIVNVGDASKLPLGDDATANPNDVVVGVDFSSPTASADISAALSAKGVSVAASSSAGGIALTSTSPALSIMGGRSRLTATTLTGAGLALPVFVDGETGSPYSGSLDGAGQSPGFAGRITVNPALIANPGALTVYATGTAAGDSARPDFLRDALNADRSFSASSGLGGASAPFSGSVGEFAQGIIAMQARASASASRIADGQSLVVSSLTDRFSSASGVDVDEEMSNLIQLQTAYGANARVITTVKEMIDMLMSI